MYTLKLRPCHNRTEQRIRSAVILSILHANCALYPEIKTGLNIEKKRALAADVYAHKIEQGAKRHWQRGKVNAAYQKALASRGIEIPPVVWEAWIESASKLNNKRRRA